jgi:chromosome segregation ATPase
MVSELRASLVQHPERERLRDLNYHNHSLKTESLRQQSDYDEELAKKNQLIDNLRDEKSVLEFKNNSLLGAVDLLERELQRIKTCLADAHQTNTALAMQYSEYKGEIHECADSISMAVKSRIGFIPRRIQKNLKRIKTIKVEI